MLNRTAAGFAAVLALTLAAPAGAGVPELASYRAVYDLVVDDTGDQGGSASVSGRLVVEFTGARCAGYRSKMRFVTEGDDSDGNSQVTDSRTETFETAEGRFEFTNETYVNDELAEESAGVATRNAANVTVSLTRPDEKTLTIDRAVVFPTEQLQRILAAAAGGEHFLSMDIYDGSQTGDVIFASATVIGKRSTAPDDYGDETLIGAAGFAGLDHWPVTVSYFEKRKGSDDTPSYVTSFVTYANGIGRKLRIDYGRFALSGRVTHLEILPTPAC